jgi:hypothetical protein
MSAMLNFFEAPRAVGNPIQLIKKSEDEIMNFINVNKGIAPVFISHNSYPTLIQSRKGSDEPYQVNVSKLFLDFDSDRKPENAQLDMMKMIEFCERENLPYLPVFSGSKGFHIYIALKPTVYTYSQFLKDATKAIHLWFKKELELRTIDLKCAEPRRLCRVFYTPHVKIDKATNKLIKNGMYCCPIQPDWVMNWKIDQIMRFATEPKHIDYTPSGDLISLDEFLTRFNINIEETLKLEFSDENTKHNVIIEYTPVENEYIKEILPLPCIHSQVMHNPNPSHFVRFATATWFAEIGMSRTWTFNFFKDRNYVDHKDDVCAQQINNIYDTKYKSPSCMRLFENGLCVGKVCKKFAGFSQRYNIKTEEEKKGETNGTEEQHACA